VVAATRFAAFGEIAGRAYWSGNVAHDVNGHLYRGEFTDPVTGAVYLRQRWYDLAAGQFKSMDPFAGFLPRPMSLTRYHFAFANPLTYLDPSGAMAIGGLGFSISLSIAVGVSTFGAMLAYGQLHLWLANPLAIGRAVERAVFPYYRTTGFLCNRQIGTMDNPPYSSPSTGLNPGLYNVRPDCRHHGSGEVFEIKPSWLALEAFDEVQNFYIPRLIQHDVANGRKTPWRPGAGRLLAPRLLFVPEFPMLLFRLTRPLPGVIAYEPRPNYGRAAAVGVQAAVATFLITQLLSHALAGGGEAGDVFRSAA